MTESQERGESSFDDVRVFTLNQDKRLSRFDAARLDQNPFWARLSGKEKRV